MSDDDIPPMDVPAMLQSLDPMSRQELVERILWAVDGYRFGYLTRAGTIIRITELIDANAETR